VTVVALGSVRGAPGVTTAALLLASCLDGTLVEADPAGGVLAVRYCLAREPGLTTLAAASGRGPARLADHAQDAGGLPVLVGPDSPEASEALWRTAGDTLARTIADAPGRVVVDAGRLQRPAAIVRRADLVVLVARPVAEHLVGAMHTVGSLRVAVDGEVAIVLAGDGPYRTDDLEPAAGCRVLAHLPRDPVAADHLRDGRRSRARIAQSRLARAVVGLAEQIDAPALDLERAPAEVRS
jgi:hypothetical protein